MSITVDSSEWDALTIRMRANMGRVGSAGSKIVRRHTLAVEGTAKILAPVDTGHLKGSISSSFNGDGRSGSMEGAVTAAARYSGYVEHGTSRMAPQPFMAPALAIHSLRFVVDVKALGGIIAGGAA